MAVSSHESSTWRHDVHRPEPLPEFNDQPPLPASPRRLELLFKRFADRMPDRLPDMKAFLLHDLRAHIDLGTFCSGTDSPALVWDAFNSFAATHLKLNITLHHAFSSEKDTGKQALILKMFPNVERLFDDVLGMGGGGGRNSL